MNEARIHYKEMQEIPGARSVSEKCQTPAFDELAIPLRDHFCPECTASDSLDTGLMVTD